MGKLFDKRDFLRLIGSAAVAAPTAIVASKSVRKDSGTHQPSAFEWVMETRTIRCGYIVWPPYLIKDVTTGEMSGVCYDMMLAVAENLDLELEWTREIFLGQEAEALNANQVEHYLRRRKRFQSAANDLYGFFRSLFFRARLRVCPCLNDKSNATASPRT